VLLAHPAQSGLPAQVPLVLRESALLALQVQLAYKEQRALVLTVPQVPRASQELPEPPALLVPQVLALQALQAFKDRLVLLVLARLATMTWVSST
jgi:hypothetical protein